MHISRSFAESMDSTRECDSLSSVIWQLIPNVQSWAYFSALWWSSRMCLGFWNILSSWTKHPNLNLHGDNTMTQSISPSSLLQPWVTETWSQILSQPSSWSWLPLFGELLWSHLLSSQFRVSLTSRKTSWKHSNKSEQLVRQQTRLCFQWDSSWQKSDTTILVALSIPS